MPPAKALVASFLDGEHLKEGPNRETDSAAVSAQLTLLSPPNEACHECRALNISQGEEEYVWYQTLHQMVQKNSAAA